MTRRGSGQYAACPMRRGQISSLGIFFIGAAGRGADRERIRAVFGLYFAKPFRDIIKRNLQELL